jgi:hypothetical protein
LFYLVKNPPPNPPPPPHPPHPYSSYPYPPAAASSAPRVMMQRIAEQATGLRSECACRGLRNRNLVLMNMHSDAAK